MSTRDSPGVKSGRCVRLTTYHPCNTERQEIRSLNLPRPPWAISTACCGRDLYQQNRLCKQLHVECACNTEKRGVWCRNNLVDEDRSSLSVCKQVLYWTISSTNPNAHFNINMYVTLLSSTCFGALTCPSSGGTTAQTQHLVSSLS